MSGHTAPAGRGHSFFHLFVQQLPQLIEPWVALGAVAAAIPFVEICAADRTKPLAAFDAQDRGGEFEENIGGSQLCQIKLPVRYYYILIVVLTVQG